MELLEMHSATMVLDVRSSPFSQYAPQFNKPNLSAELPLGGITYAFAGNELGARSTDSTVYTDGSVDFELLGKSKPYKSGIRRIVELSEGETVVVLCTEKDPVTCHRGILITRLLSDLGVSINHILENGELESQQMMEERMWETEGLPSMDMFRDHDMIIREAYSMVAAKIAWKDPSYVARTGEHLEH